MLPYENINIQRMIVHTVDHHKFTEPRLSDLDSPVNEDVQFFLRRHIVNNREHRYARSGVFLDAPNAEDADFRTACDELLASPAEFIAKSKEIAQHLFRSISTNRKISPGELVVATFTDGSKAGKPWLALLKMDPEDGFIGDREETEEGVRIILRRVPNVLPNSELQKCAFILPQDSRTNKRHLIVLDQQTARRGAMRMVATFFVSKFLQCRVDLNKKEKTNAFVVGSFDFSGSKKGVWTEEQREKLDAAVATALESDSVDVELVARTAISNPDEQEEYIKYIRSQMQGDGFEDLVFETDPDARNQQDYFVVEGDNELKIRVRADAVGANKTLEFQKDEATNTHIATVRTVGWKAGRVRGKR